ncbi:MAG: transporter substrate-binding domain-containing protein [Oligoflexia bacterium]|nr:transporter substrate-binding domain-containing protein [Oligoflexia bacterium]
MKSRNFLKSRFHVNFSLVLFLFSLNLFLINSVIAKVYKIGSYPIPLMVVSKDKGVFVELAHEIAKKQGVEIEIVIAPPPETVKNFVDKKLDGFFPGLDVLIPVAFSKSESIYIKKDFAFYRKAGDMLNTLDKLKGKKVGLTEGYPYAKSVTENKSYSILFSPNDIINIKKLSASSLDAFIVEEKTGLKAVELAAAKDQVTYDPKMPISDQDVYFAFQGDADGKMLAQKYSDGLKAMKTDGSFSKIMDQATKQQ